MVRRSGIDIGGVIIGGKTDGCDVLIYGNTDKRDMFFTPEYMQTPPVEGAFEGIRSIVQQDGPENVHIVSKCGRGTWLRSLEWMRQPFALYGGLNFFEFTGIFDREDAYLHRCKKWAQKALIAQSLGLTDFYDDRSEVLVPMKGIVANRYLVGRQTGPTPEGIILFPHWSQMTARP